MFTHLSRPRQGGCARAGPALPAAAGLLILAAAGHALRLPPEAGADEGVTVMFVVDSSLVLKGEANRRGVASRSSSPIR